MRCEELLGLSSARNRGRPTMESPTSRGRSRSQQRYLRLENGQNFANQTYSCRFDLRAEDTFAKMGVESGYVRAHSIKSPRRLIGSPSDSFDGLAQKAFAFI